jgi:hypothetical protein
MTNDQLIASALYDFIGYLTGGKGTIEVGASSDVVPLIDRLKAWARERDLNIESKGIDVHLWESARNAEADDREFLSELERLINCYSMENGSDTPDFILAQYLTACLKAFDETVVARTKWYAPLPKEGD